MEKKESNIISRILSGRTDEFSYFLDAYGQAVYTLIVRIVDSECDAEELAQDTFMKAFEKLSSFDGRSSFSTWIYRIAYNTAISFVRKKNVEVNVFDEAALSNIAADDEIDDALNNDTEEQIMKLQKALSMLSPEERTLVALFYEEEKPISEIRQILDITESNVKVKLHRIRKKLYMLIKEG